MLKNLKNSKISLMTINNCHQKYYIIIRVYYRFKRDFLYFLAKIMMM